MIHNQIEEAGGDLDLNMIRSSPWVDPSAPWDVLEPNQSWHTSRDISFTDFPFLELKHTLILQLPNYQPLFRWDDRNNTENYDSIGEFQIRGSNMTPSNAGDWISLASWPRWVKSRPQKLNKNTFPCLKNKRKPFAYRHNFQLEVFYPPNG